MTVVEVLKAARAKIAQGWTQGEPARNDRGEGVPSRNAGAVCWCVVGAVRAVEPNDCTDAFLALRAAVARENEFLADWNDAPGRTQAEVLAAFDKAIAAEEAKS